MNFLVRRASIMDADAGVQSTLLVVLTSVATCRLIVEMEE
jgi:hypothetical protein